MEGSLQLFDWTRNPRFFLLADVGLTIPCLILEAYGVVLIAFAFRKRLDAARWIVAILALLADLYTAIIDSTGLGDRWTHWTIADRIISSTRFHIGGSDVDLLMVINVLLLVSIVYAVSRTLVEQNRRQSVLEQEYRSAQELQQLLIPEALPSLPGFALTSSYRPAQEVGGDFFQIIPLEGEESTLIILGDVSGKGLKAAMAVSLIVGIVRALAKFTMSPAELLTLLNERLTGRLRGGFATCIVLRLGADGSCTIASAGHPAPFLNDREINLPGALPVGIAALATYEEATIQLNAGDRLALYTDGVLEARNRSGELFGFDRLHTLFTASPSASQATEAAVAFGQEDDITVLTLSFAPVGVLSA